MASRHLSAESRWLLALLAALVALGPLSVDMYLPAMPAMKETLNTTIGNMHLTLSAYLAGFAFFHLLCGPLADRYGRRPILLSGTGLFVLGCVGCALSSSVTELLLFRFTQGVGACVGPTLARTITRDIFGPRRAARALSLIAMLMALAPAIAPGLGGVMLLFLPWTSIFVFLAVYGALIIVLIYRYLPESLPEKQSLHPQVLLGNVRELLVDPFFLSVTIASSLVYAGLMTYLSSSSFVYIEMLGVPVEYFGLTFTTAVIGYMAGSAVSAKLSRAFDSEQVMLLGTVLAMIASALMLAGSSLWPLSVMALVLPMTLYSAGLGLVLPHAMAIALRPFPHIAGTASSLLGFIQMSLSAGASALAGVFLHDSPQPMLWSMLGTAVLAWVIGRRAHALYQTQKA